MLPHLSVTFVRYQRETPAIGAGLVLLLELVGEVSALAVFKLCPSNVP